MAQPRVDVPADARAALEVLSLLSKKWQPVVILALTHHGPAGFNDLLEVIPDASGKALSEALDTLTDAGVVERTVISESPLRVEYELTRAGREMEPILEALAEWGRRHLEAAEPTVAIADGDPRLVEMYAEWLDDRYAVSTAHTGRGFASDLEADPDIVVFEWGLPGTDPAAVVDAVDANCRTIVLVGDRPQIDLLALDCDDVRRKPIVRERALDAIESQLSRRGESAARRERSALAAKLSLLESVYSRDTLEANATYVESRSRLDALDDELDE